MVEVFLSLVVVIDVCSVGMASTELVWIVAGPLALASEVEKCTSVEALDEGLTSCVCLGLTLLVPISVLSENPKCFKLPLLPPILAFYCANRILRSFQFRAQCRFLIF